MANVSQPQNLQQWLNASQELAKKLKNTNTLPIISDYQFTNSNVNDYTELIKTVVVGGLSMIPTIGNPLSILVSAVWAHIISNTNETTYEVYNSYREMIKATIDNSIDMYDASTIKAVLTKLNALVIDYTKAKKNYKLTPNQAPVKKDLVDAHNLLYIELRGSLLPLSDLRKEGYEAQELGAFALMATLHLLLLKEGSTNGKTWGISESKIETFEQEFNKNMVEYAQHCKLAYYKGVAKIKALGIDGVMQFNKLNTFRSFCARYVFDYVNLWPGFNGTIFPNGCYSENVRYIFSDVIGRPIDPSQTAKPNKPYYYPSCDFLEKIFIDREFDLYQKEFRRVEFTHSNDFMYAIQSFYNDPSESSGERVGEKVGNLNKTGGIILLPSSSNATVTNFIGGYDVQPRYISYPSGISSNFSSVTVDLGPTNCTGGEVYDTEMDYIAKDMDRGGYSDLGMRIDTNVSVTNHKVSTFRGLNTNYETMTFDGSERSGILDAMVVGLQPINIYNDNWLYNNIATVVNAQKFFNRENCSFARDFVLPTVHAMCINVGGKLRFRFQLKDSTQTKFNFGIRYHYSNTNTEGGSISVRNANGVEILGGPVSLAKCNVDTGSTINEFKTKTLMAKIVNLSVSTVYLLTIANKGGPVYVHSIIMFPVKATEAA
ncbi:hypothetical protein ACTFIW_010788 [Dictyostelium discoideum]